MCDVFVVVYVMYTLIYPKVSVNLFDYSGAILSYCLIGIPVFLGAYDSLDVASLSSLISKVCCVYMCTYVHACLSVFV